VRVSARVDYAVRAAVELAAPTEGPIKGESVADAQQIPLKFLENILLDLKQAGIVRSQRGPEGGYWLARPAAEVSVADVIRAVEGPLATVRGARPETLEYEGSASPLQRVWIALRSAMRDVLETVSLADLAANSLPAAVERRAGDPDAWSPTEDRRGARVRRRQAPGSARV
jgi:Rrf2 family protein